MTCERGWTYRTAPLANLFGIIPTYLGNEQLRRLKPFSLKKRERCWGEGNTLLKPEGPPIVAAIPW